MGKEETEHTWIEASEHIRVYMKEIKGAKHCQDVPRREERRVSSNCGMGDVAMVR